MVAGGDDRQQRDGRVGEPPPAVPARGDGDDADRHHQRPSEVQRRHRRELIGHRSTRVVGIDAGAVHAQRVDVPLEHPRRCERERDVDHHRRHRDADEPVPDRRVLVAVAGERPDQEGCGGGEVHADVEVVEDVDHARHVEDESLHRQLDGPTEPPLDVEYSVCVRLCHCDRVVRDDPARPVHPEHRRRDRQFRRGAHQHRTFAGAAGRSCECECHGATLREARVRNVPPSVDRVVIHSEDAAAAIESKG